MCARAKLTGDSAADRAEECVLMSGPPPPVMWLGQATSPSPWQLRPLSAGRRERDALGPPAIFEPREEDSGCGITLARHVNFAVSRLGRTGLSFFASVRKHQEDFMLKFTDPNPLVWVLSNSPCTGIRTLFNFAPAPRGQKKPPTQCRECSMPHLVLPPSQTLTPSCPVSAS